MLSCLLFAALLSTAENGLTTLLSCVMLPCVFVTFQYGVSGQVRYLIVSIPGICLLLYYYSYGFVRATV